MENYLIQLLLTYKYAILIPIAFFEGHIISLIAGFLARMGYLNPFIAGAFIVIGNLLGDIVLYWIGYYKGEKIIKKWGGYIHVSEESFQKSHQLFHKYRNYVLFLSKITNGFGLSMAVLFTAGAARIPFGVYLWWNILGECAWTGLLIAIGYFFGQLYSVANNVILRVGLVVFGILILGIIFIHVRNYIQNKVKI